MDQLKKRLTRAALLLLAVHLSISMYLTLGTSKRNTFTIFYNQHLLPGPFFNERHIQISPHLRIAYKSNNTWSPLTDYGIEKFSEYVKSPWHYAALKESDYLRNIMRRSYNKINDREFQEYRHDAEFTELNRYLLGEIMRGILVDSIHLVYVFKKYDGTTKQVQVDTMLNIHYNPLQVVVLD